MKKTWQHQVVSLLDSSLGVFVPLILVGSILGLAVGGSYLESRIVLASSKTLTVSGNELSTMIQSVRSSKSRKDIKLVTVLSKGLAVEVKDQMFLGQFDSATEFGAFQLAQGNPNTVCTISYGGWDNSFLSIHPLMIQNKSSCVSQ